MSATFVGATTRVASLAAAWYRCCQAPSMTNSQARRFSVTATFMNRARGIGILSAFWYLVSKRILRFHRLMQSAAFATIEMGRFTGYSGLVNSRRKVKMEVLTVIWNGQGINVARGNSMMLAISVESVALHSWFLQHHVPLIPTLIFPFFPQSNV